MSADNGGPAFPRTGNSSFAKPQNNRFDNEPETGMSLRDYFAAHCPITWDEAQNYNTGGTDEMQWFVAMRLQYADTMIAIRNKSK
tara:strand:- start:400 stop:654 length:255 start_codon:yes stop_codon:yes gene_type:complete